MADVMKKLAAAMEGQLMPGETLLGGCKCAGKNAALKAGVAAGGGLVGGVVGAAIPGGDQRGGTASDVPQDRIFWIAVTDHRLVYFNVGSMTSTPKKLVGSSPLGSLAGVQVKRGKVFRRMTFVFADDTAAVVDAYRASDPDSLQNSLTQVLPGRVQDAG